MARCNLFLASVTVVFIRCCPAALLALAWLLTAGVVAPARADDALLSQDVSALFAARTARIGPYVAWTYDWATSYANSYRAAFHVIRHILTAPAGQRGDVLGVLRALQQQSLRQRVSRPAEDAYQIARLINRHAAARLYVLAAEAVAAACTGSTSQSPAIRTAKHAAYVTTTIGTPINTSWPAAIWSTSGTERNWMRSQTGAPSPPYI